MKKEGILEYPPPMIYLTHFPYKSLGLSVNFVMKARLVKVHKATNMYMVTNINIHTAINILNKYIYIYINL